MAEGTKLTQSAEASSVSASDQASHPEARVGRPAINEDRQWWFDARGLQDADGATLDSAYQSGCSVIVVDIDQQDSIMTAKPRVVYVERAEQLDKLVPDVWVLTADEDLLAKVRQAGRKAGCFISVDSLEQDFPRCQQIVKRGYDFVVIDMHHARRAGHTSSQLAG
jgi:hypothetical protein